MNRVFTQADGSVKYLTPRDPYTGLSERRFDPLDWIDALVRQIPDPRMHLIRYAGAYANRVRRRYRAEEVGAKEAAEEEEKGSGTESGEKFTTPAGPLAAAGREVITRHRTLMCDDVEALVADMTSKGRACTPVSDEGWGRLTSVALPGGGQLGIYEPRHASPLTPDAGA